MLPIVTKCKVVVFRRSPCKVKQRRASFCRVVRFEYKPLDVRSDTGSVVRAVRTLMAPELKDDRSNLVERGDSVLTESLFMEVGRKIKDIRESVSRPCSVFL